MNQFEKEKKELYGLLLKMINLVNDNIKEAISFYKYELETVTINDDVVNNYEKLIQGICIDIIVKERLYAKDLREISSILKLVSDVERIGDHAEDILKFSKELHSVKNYNCNRINELIDLSIEMSENAIKSFIDKDINLAMDTIKKDDIVDEIYDEILKELSLYNNTSNDVMKYVIYTTLIVKYLERIADHATNIAEWSIYTITGIYK